MADRNPEGDVVIIRLSSQGRYEPVEELQSTRDLAWLLARAARINDAARSKGYHKQGFDISGKSLLLAFLISDDPWSQWFKPYPDAREASIDALLEERKLNREELGSITSTSADASEMRAVRQTGHGSSLVANARELCTETARQNTDEPLDVRHLIGAYIYRPTPKYVDKLASWGYDRSQWSQAFLERIQQEYPAELEFWREIDLETFPGRAGNLGGAGNDAAAAEDQLGFERYAEAFAELIASPSTHPPLTIGIYGSWGMGKSSLLEQIKSKLPKRKSPDSPTHVHVVSFNAWEYSATDAIWPGLVRNIMDTIDRDNVGWGRFRRFRKKFRRNARRQTQQIQGPLILLVLLIVILLIVIALMALWQSVPPWQIILGIAGSIAALGALGVLKLVQDSLTNTLGRWVTALFQESDYGRRIEYMDDISGDLKDLGKQLDNQNRRILAVIDDLDRCEPKKAVEMLQAINLLLNFKGFIVCLGIDARIITAAVEKHYEGLLGEAGASGYEYLEKIVQIPFRIPQPSDDEIKTFIAKQLGDPKPPPEVREATTTRGASPRPVEEPEDEAVDDRDREVEQRVSGSGGRTLGAGGEISVVGPDARVPFTHQELKAFQDLAQFLRPNPRYLKRLVNIYRLVRSLLVRAKDERTILDKPAATIRWLVTCDQWPYTAHVMLRRFSQMLKEWSGSIPNPPPAEDPLLHLLEEVKPDLSKEKQHKYDQDIALLEDLLKYECERLTWGELRRIRQYTVNFNPAIEEDLQLLTTADRRETRQPSGDGQLSGKESPQVTSAG